VNNLDYNEWAKKRIDQLMHLQIKSDNEYIEELIREYLVFSQNSKAGEVIIEFFKENNRDENLFKVILGILLDESEDYSNDARYSAAKIISYFDLDILKKYKKELLYAQNYKLKNLRPFFSDTSSTWLYE
jgi:hypothetical protein